MNYRIISKDLLIKLTNKEAYTFICILLNSDLDTYISHIKEDTLSDYTGYCKKTISTYIQKFKELGLLTIETNRIKGEKGYFNRNTYHLIRPNENYFRVEYDYILNDTIDKKTNSDIKGYLLLLKCICYGGNNFTFYSLNEIAQKKLLQIGLSTIKDLTCKAIKLNILTSNDNKYTITTPFIYADQEKVNPDSDYLEYYQIIKNHCKKNNITPPKYERELMETIYYNCAVPSIFIDKLSNRPFSERKINSLRYFIQVLGFKYQKKQPKTEFIFVM